MNLLLNILLSMLSFLINSSTHLFFILFIIFNFVNSFIHYSVNSFIHYFINSFIHYFINTLIHYFINSFIHSFHYPSNHAFTYEYIEVDVLHKYIEKIGRTSQDFAELCGRTDSNIFDVAQENVVFLFYLYT